MSQRYQVSCIRYLSYHNKLQLLKNIAEIGVKLNQSKIVDGAQAKIVAKRPKECRPTELGSHVSKH